MPILAELMDQIDELDPVEHERLLHSLIAKQLKTEVSSVQGFPSIVSSPNVCGGAARFIRTRIPVWTVERMWQLGISDSDILRSYPTLQATDLMQAWAYVQKHRAEIEQAIRDNEAE